MGGITYGETYVCLLLGVATLNCDLSVIKKKKKGGGVGWKQGLKNQMEQS